MSLASSSGLSESPLKSPPKKLSRSEKRLQKALEKEEEHKACTTLAFYSEVEEQSAPELTPSGVGSSQTFLRIQDVLALPQYQQIAKPVAPAAAYTTELEHLRNELGFAQIQLTDKDAELQIAKEEAQFLRMQLCKQEQQALEDAHCAVVSDVGKHSLLDVSIDKLEHVEACFATLSENYDAMVLSNAEEVGVLENLFAIKAERVEGAARYYEAQYSSQEQLSELREHVIEDLQSKLKQIQQACGLP